MTVADVREYRFALAAQWAAGACTGLEVRGARLVVPAGLALVPVAGPGRADGGAAPAVDPLGRTTWLRPASRVLLRRPPPGSGGVVELGTLGSADDAGPVRRLVCGRGLVWVLGARLDRYATRTLQRLTPPRPVDGWVAEDADDDGSDGVWLAETGPRGRRRVRHVDCWGRTCAEPVDLPDATGDGPGIAVAADGRVVLLDRTEAHVVDPATSEVTRIGLDVPSGAGRTSATSARGDRLHLLTPLDDGRAVYRVIALDGGVRDLQVLDVPCELGTPTALAGGPDGLVVAGTRGLADLAAEPGPGAERCSEFVTPALVSPPGPRPGWNRAEIDAVLPEGTAMEVTWAATGQAGLIDRVRRLLDGPAPADLGARLDRLLPWRTDRGVTYRGSGRGGVERLAIALDDVPEATVWIRIRFRTPPGRTPPELVALHVRYPDVSYLDHLPAIYRTDPAAAARLRAVLAPYEVLFDGLDATLAGLAERADPAAADDDHTAQLLELLGFGPLDELPPRVRRALLDRAGDVLELRGTVRGLDLLLDLVTEGRATVLDGADAPGVWFLGRGDGPSTGDAPARLGRDTLAVAQQPPPARTGRMVLGATPVGRGCPDPALVVAERAATVTIEVDSELDGDTVAVVDRLLAAFVPAHCRVRVVRRTGTRGLLLDVDLRADTDAGRLYGDDHWRLAATTRLGGWALPVRAGPLRLDDETPPGDRPRLH